MGWLMREGKMLPPLKRRVEQLFSGSDAKAPADRASLSALHFMLTTLDFIAEEQVSELRAACERRLGEIERQFAKFNPVKYADAEFGRKSCSLQFSDREVILTTEILPSDGTTHRKRAELVLKQEVTIRELESQLIQAQRAITSLNKRLTAMELGLVERH